MQTFHFFGRIYPNIPQWDWEWRGKVAVPDLEVKDCQIILKYKDADVFAALSVEENQLAQDVATLRNLVETIVRSHIDSFGYLEGYGLEFSVNKVQTPTGEESFMFPMVPDLKNERHLLSYYNKHLELARLADSSWHLSNALASFRHAIREHGHTGAFCFRSIESIREYFRKDTPNIKIDKQNEIAWSDMNTALAIHRSITDEMRPFALPQRHGAPKANLDKHRSLLLRRTSAMINRFCFYISPGISKQPLTNYGYTQLVCDGNECLDPTLHS